MGKSPQKIIYQRFRTQLSAKKVDIGQKSHFRAQPT